MRNVGKQFGRVWVLRDVSLAVAPGTIHAIVGHNGAGKSTLMKIAIGTHEPTEGEVRIGGRKLDFRRPAQAREMGLGMVFQERSLVPTLSGLDNLFLNSEISGPLGLLRRAREVNEVESLFDVLGLARSVLRLRVSEMSMIEQELLEVAKALRLANKVLILDEPTAPLGRDEIHRLFGVMRSVADQGTGIVLITHHLGEVFEVSDRVTCLREGSVVMDTETKATTVGELIRAMLGRDLAAKRGPGALSTAPATTDPVARPTGAGGQQATADILQVRNLQVGQKLSDVSFSVSRGEIFGIAGLGGSGRTTLLRTLFGDLRAAEGSVLLQGRPYAPRSPKKAISERVFLIPEDRGLHGLMSPKPITENLVLPVLRRYSNGAGLLRTGVARRRAGDLCRLLEIRARRPEQIVGELSGGNQQKVVMAKGVEIDADLLLLDEPTFGVDIGTAEQIAVQVRKMARERGAAVLWASSDLVELLEVADRIMVLRDGGIGAVVHRGDTAFNEESLILLMQRHKVAPAGKGGEKP